MTLMRKALSPNSGTNGSCGFDIRGLREGVLTPALLCGSQRNTAIQNRCPAVDKRAKIGYDSGANPPKEIYR